MSIFLNMFFDKALRIVVHGLPLFLPDSPPNSLLLLCKSRHSPTNLLRSRCASRLASFPPPPNSLLLLYKSRHSPTNLLHSQHLGPPYDLPYFRTYHLHLAMPGFATRLAVRDYMTERWVKCTNSYMYYFLPQFIHVLFFVSPQGTVLSHKRKVQGKANALCC